MKRLAVVGKPVAHSLSPAMHTAALEQMGLAGEWSYEAIEVSAADFESVIRALPEAGFAGVNVTIPHKEAALAVADAASETAQAIGAANTLTFAARRIEAENTDAEGLLASLPRSPRGERALVLGAGGAARAAAWALADAGAEVSVWNRTAERAQILARDFGIRTIVTTREDEPLPIDSFAVVVNATSVGMRAPAGQMGGPLKGLGLTDDAFNQRHLVVDLAYAESETELGHTAHARGAHVVDGREVLVNQGAASLRIWTGEEPPLDEMRKAIAIKSQLREEAAGGA